MAKTEKLGDLNDKASNEKAKMKTNSDKLGSSQDGKGRLAAWYAKHKKAINITCISLLVVGLLLLVYFLWLVPKWNADLSERAQPTLSQRVLPYGNAMMSSDTAMLKEAIQGSEDGEIEGLLDLINSYDHPVFKTARAAKFSLKYYTALCYLKRGEEDEALDMLLKMKKRDNYLWYEGQMLIGDLYDDKGDKENAIKYYNNAVEGETDLVAPIALWKLGMLCERDGDWAGAFENYEKIKNDYPERYENGEFDKYYERAKIKAGK